MASPRNRNKNREIPPQRSAGIDPAIPEQEEEERLSKEDREGEDGPEYVGPPLNEEEMAEAEKEYEEPHVPELTKSGQQKASHYNVSRKGEISERKMTMIDPQDLGLGQFQEPHAMPEGFEAHLRIVSVRKAVNSSGNDYLQPTLEILDEPLAKDFTHYLGIPSKETMTPKQYQQSGFYLQEFMQGFGIPLDEPTEPTEEWVGYEAWNILGIKESADYGRQNKLGKFIRGE